MLKTLNELLIETLKVQPVILTFILALVSYDLAAIHKIWQAQTTIARDIKTWSG
ncbi:MAG: hypothetical protein ABI042_10055 [Verrucomicrobiota bacterium]